MRGLDRDRALRLSRRIDWRFLLPDPSLNTVGYFGPGADQLLESLRAFAGVADLLTEHDIGAARLRRRYDVIVLQGVEAIDPRIRELLKPDGHVYAEFKRADFRPVKRRAASAAFYPRARAAAGVREARIHWHWPEFETCTRIVPLDVETPLAFVITRGEQGLKANLVWIGVSLMVRGGVLSRSASCFSVIARAW